MSTPLPPHLVQVERALEESRAALPAGLRARVLAASASARAAAAPPAAARRSGAGWFAASVALAAAVLLNFSGSAALSSPGARANAEAGAPLARCALSRLFEPSSGPCFTPASPPARQE